MTKLVSFLTFANEIRDMPATWWVFGFLTGIGFALLIFSLFPELCK
jgi:hypothetical protein